MKISVKTFAVLLSMVVVALIGNVLYLDFQMARLLATAKRPIPNLPEASVYPSQVPFPISVNASASAGVTYGQMNEAIKMATQSLTLAVQNIQITPRTQTLYASPVANTTTVKEYYIPLGYGSTNSTDWVDLPGVEAYVAPLNYGKIKEMYFEAGISIPTGSGEVYARLRNVTDSISLFESEVHRNGESGGLASSGKIPVPTSTKLYRVQLRSSIGAEVKLDNARIKIFVQ